MRTSSKRYLWGITMVVLGGASLADHITDGVGSFPISAVFLGIGIVLTAWSYRK